MSADRYLRRSSVFSDNTFGYFLLYSRPLYSYGNPFLEQGLSLYWTNLEVNDNDWARGFSPLRIERL